MISFDFGNNCYGCSVCVDACPVEAIREQKGNNGFCFPVIDVNKCVNCGLCERVCPYLRAVFQNYTCQELFCAKHKDEKTRLIGSSGSVFYALAKSHIESKKGVVVASGFDSGLQLRHQIVKTIEDVIPLMKSKYIQSSTIGIFRKVKSLLNDMVPILFVGSPCQCQAVINYVSQEQRDLLTLVDFVCHGVPSQDLFDRWKGLYERQHDCHVVRVSFREKDDKYVRYFKIMGVNNKTKEPFSHKGLPQDWSYYNGFLDHTIFRPSCFNCRFKSINRVSDITLGDFWGLELVNSDIKDFNKGYSMVVVNSDKGKQVFDGIKQDVFYEKYPLEVAVDNNHAFAKKDEQPKLNRYFMKWYSRLPMSVLDKLFLTSTPALHWRCLRKILRGL